MLETLLLCLYILVILVGIAGNTLVILVVKRTRSMHTTTNHLLVNLAVSDIVALLWCPAIYSITLAKIHPAGIAGDILCKIFTGNEIVDIATSVSIINLTFLAIERYHALIRPMRYDLRLTMDNLPYAIAIIWAIAIVVSIPGFIQFSYVESKQSCIGPWGLYMTSDMAIFALCMVIFFVFNPFLIVTFCYSQIIRGLFFNNTICAQPCSNEQDKRSKQKLAKLFVTITVGFFACHMPFTVFMMYISSRKISDPNRMEDVPVFITFQFLSLLSLTNSCINPIFYAFQSSNYRRGFKRIFYGRNFVAPFLRNDATAEGLAVSSQSQPHA